MSGGGRFGKLLGDVGETIGNVATFTTTVVQATGETVGQFASDVATEGRAVSQVLGHQAGDVVRHGRAMAQVAGNQLGNVLEQGEQLAGAAADTATDVVNTVAATGEHIAHAVGNLGHHKTAKAHPVRRPLQGPQ